MRDEYIAIGPLGTSCLILAGFLSRELFGLLRDPDAPGLALLIFILLLAVRSEARQPIQSGTYQRGWFRWKRIGGLN